jgi:signal transduction histidine kinase/ActR/RegA family two-component response regulator
MKLPIDALFQETAATRSSRERAIASHRNGAIARSSASVLLFIVAIGAYWLGVLPGPSMLGIAVAVLLLLLIGLPALAILRRLPQRAFWVYSFAVHATELLAYTAVIHFCGGIEAAFLTGIYAAMTAYVGIVLPRPWPFRVALASAAALGALVLLEHQGLLAHRPLVPHAHLPPVIQGVSYCLSIAILFVVAYLATQGADTIRRGKDSLRQQNVALQAATADAIHSDRLKSEFLATMSHEIRTPLNGVIGMTSLLLNTPLNEDQRIQVDTIRTSGQALLEIISDILDLSKVDAGAIELDASPFDIRSCCQDAISIVKGTADAKNVALSAEFSSNLPRALLGDFSRLRQILLNLIGNAVKFTDRGTVLLAVSGTAEQERFLLTARVEDTGVGISESEASRLFRPFVQVDSSRTRRFKGTGLGLTISKRLAELMGGDIQYRPRPGGGSIFELEVPLRRATGKAKTSDLAPLVGQAPARVIEPGTHRHLRILVVDDNSVNLRVASMMLKSMGYDADSAADGVEALAAIERVPYDLVLMDVQMPNLDGIEATRRIRSGAYRHQGAAVSPRIVGLSANALASDREICLAVGMDGYITKPTQVDDIRKAIAETLEMQERIVAD